MHIVGRGDKRGFHGSDCLIPDLEHLKECPALRLPDNALVHFTIGIFVSVYIALVVDETAEQDDAAGLINENRLTPDLVVEQISAQSEFFFDITDRPTVFPPCRVGGKPGMQLAIVSLKRLKISIAYCDHALA